MTFQELEQIKTAYIFKGRDDFKGHVKTFDDIGGRIESKTKRRFRRSVLKEFKGNEKDSTFKEVAEFTSVLIYDVLLKDFIDDLRPLDQAQDIAFQEDSIDVYLKEHRAQFTKDRSLFSYAKYLAYMKALTELRGLYQAWRVQAIPYFSKGQVNVMLNEDVDFEKFRELAKSGKSGERGDEAIKPTPAPEVQETKAKSNNLPKDYSKVKISHLVGDGFRVGAKTIPYSKFSDQQRAIIEMLISDKTISAEALSTRKRKDLNDIISSAASVSAHYTQPFGVPISLKDNKCTLNLDITSRDQGIDRYADFEDSSDQYADTAYIKKLTGN